MTATKVGIIGASGYTGLELIKILINHPFFEITYVATSSGGLKLDAMHPSLKDVFTCRVEKADSNEIIKRCDLVFLALPHQASMGFAKDLLNQGVKVVDLSADYRLDLETYEKHYCEHSDKEHLAQAVYGLPELYREEIKKSSLVANPGCYPTASILALVPFTPYINEDFPIFIDAKSGVTGAGKKSNDLSHYVNINENIFAYKVLSHRHEPEIKEKLLKFSSKNFDVNFVPHLIPATRGELIDAYMLITEDINPLEILKEFYKDELFVRIFDGPVDIKSCAGTNFCDIYAQVKGKKLYVNSAVDNILRGSSSQAVANANLMCGYDEHTALPTIAYVP
ncbi:N-acetyl-gamma-glutamyl-phosphate reductase [Sulfurimonas sp. MAG313]|nr:N-acetyl-gamma-glutamyl-phosphate reductase [Sulfurimonas sp. MAG313]MDF1881265.1 N-acetyl-gamma-glutamyl-phosphate reductase [Sulfurimonas sp. MAG313]